MLDTRRQRSHRKVGTLASAELFDVDTLNRLLDWLDSTNRPKFVVSPSMVLPRHRRAVQRDGSLNASNLSALHSDGWDGYPGTLQKVLGHIADEGISNVVFLSGDEHRSSIASAEIFDMAGQLVTKFKSIHTAAMWAPFPFANAIDEDIVENDEFVIESAALQQFTCKVQSRRPPRGDGPTYVSVSEDGDGWKLDCEFAGGVVETLVL
ncbi:alkaline phosphatase D family protein [Ruegeria sp. 2012CJ41-6]|uniref:Alkaline phosphatase D family protein n=1 Tax=Ruegeria spongiae TaxID=2942209 RepID=A0ABT0Q8B2_9RHOB|nr:alkaline phosphatase D family protein [Ruegeria spongiae]